MKHLKLLLLTLAFASMTSCIAQAPKSNNHLELYGLKGPVSEIKETHFDGPYIEVYQFDTLGRLTQFRMLANPGMALEEDMDFWETMEARYYWYDDKGNIQGDEEDIENFPGPYGETYENTELYTVKRNNRGDIIEYTSKRFPDIHRDVHVYYDSHGNWVGKAEIRLNEFDVDVLNIISREIKYYE